MSASLSVSLLPPNVINMLPDPSVPSICVAIMSAALSGLATPRIWTVRGALLRVLNTAVDTFLAFTRFGTLSKTIALDFLATVKSPEEDFLPLRNVVRK